jgi:hypothetical protein
MMIGEREARVVEGKITGYRDSYFTADGRRRYVSAKTKTEAR